VLPDYAPAVFGGSHNEAEKASMTVLPATDPLNVEAGQLIFVVSGNFLRARRQRNQTQLSHCTQKVASFILRVLASISLAISVFILSYTSVCYLRLVRCHWNLKGLSKFVRLTSALLRH